MTNILPRSFYERDTNLVAQDLLGKKLIHIVNNHKLVGIISETEAYKSTDPACHGYRGLTQSNKSLFDEVGHAYVYISYGIHYCLNIVSRNKSECKAGGVLIRSIIPIEGIQYMQIKRKVDLKNLANGPGKLTQAFSITKNDDGVDVTSEGSSIIVAQGITLKEDDIAATKRIGISQNKDALLRFIIKHEKEMEIKNGVEV